MKNEQLSESKKDNNIRISFGSEKDTSDEYSRKRLLETLMFINLKKLRLKNETYFELKTKTYEFSMHYYKNIFWITIKFLNNRKEIFCCCYIPLKSVICFENKYEKLYSNLLTKQCLELFLYYMIVNKKFNSVIDPSLINKSKLALI